MIKLTCSNLLLFFSLSVVSVWAQRPVIIEEADTKAMYEILSHTDSLLLKPTAVKMVAIGKLLMNKPYQAKTLETGREESLVVNLRAFDCTTFLETILAFARLIPLASRNNLMYSEILANIRYRDGKSDSYPDRLHYLTDWLEEKEQHGEMVDITQKLGGVPYEKEINFMTTHPQAYVQLGDNRNLTKMKAVEKKLNTQKRYYIPKAAVGKIESQLQEGDIIAITTNIKGLDVVHVGLAILKGRRIHLLHASSDQKKVAISALPLTDYLQKNAGQSGIIVTRPQS